MDISQLRANQRFLVTELLERGVAVSVFDAANEILEAHYGKHRELLFDIDSSIMPYASSIIAGSKSLTKLLLKRAEVSVPKGERFRIEDSLKATKYAEEELSFPVVVKPSVGVQGEDVHTGVVDARDLLAAITSIQEHRGSCEILVEEHFEAKEYRVFITKTGKFAVLHRDPSHVVGDGVLTIAKLAALETHRRLTPRKNCLGEIVLDEEALRFLRRNGITPRSVPAAGEKVYLRGSSNVKMGGVPEDVTDLIHPSFVAVAQRALAAIPFLPYAGLDLMTYDISKPATPENYRLIEINSVPGIGIHMAPGKGRPRNVASMIVDLIFPETVSQGVFAEEAA